MLVVGIGSLVDMEDRMVVGLATFVTLCALDITVNRAMSFFETAIAVITKFHHLVSLEHTGFQKGGAGVDFMSNRTTTCSTCPPLPVTCAVMSAAG